MTDFSIFILCAGLGVGAFFISCAYAHRIFSETRMKARALEQSLKDDNVEVKSADEMQKRLEELRRARFSPPVSQRGTAIFSENRNKMQGDK